MAFAHTLFFRNASKQSGSGESESKPAAIEDTSSLPAAVELPRLILVSAGSSDALAAMGATHWVWVRHFHSTYHSTEYVLGFFFMIVWFVPFGFFISIAANESVLPGGATVPGAPSSGNLGGYDPNRGGGKKTRNALLMLLDTLKLYWTRLSERFMPKGGIPGTYRDTHQKGW